jgi:hypothetical protein
MTLEKAQIIKKRLDLVASAGESKVDVQIVHSAIGYNIKVVPSDDRILCINFYIMAAGADQIGSSVVVENGKPCLHIIGLN